MRFLGQLLVLGPAAASPSARPGPGSWPGRPGFHIRRVPVAVRHGWSMGASSPAKRPAERVPGRFAAGLAITALTRTCATASWSSARSSPRRPCAGLRASRRVLFPWWRGPVLATLAWRPRHLIIRPLVVGSVLRLDRAGLSRYAPSSSAGSGPGSCSLLFACCGEDGRARRRAAVRPGRGRGAGVGGRPRITPPVVQLYARRASGRPWPGTRAPPPTVRPEPGRIPRRSGVANAAGPDHRSCWSASRRSTPRRCTHPAGGVLPTRSRVGGRPPS